MPVRIFYSYSHCDEKRRARLSKHLALLRREGLIEEWSDRAIDAGAEWERAIYDELDAADIILLLISADFMDSDFCWSKELGRALARHDKGKALVIPVIMRPVDWRGAPFGRLQALPRDAKPIEKWSPREDAWRDVAEGIRKRVEAIAKGVPVERRPSGSSILPGALP